jgi:anti-anti-sigma factor
VPVSRTSSPGWRGRSSRARPPGGGHGRSSDAASLARPALSRSWTASPLLLTLVVGLAYAAGSQLAFSWFAADGTNSSFFPAAGVTAGALLCTPRRLWPFALAGAGSAELVLDMLHGINLTASLGYAVANVAEPTVGAMIVTSIVGRPDLTRLRDLATFLLGSVTLAPVVGAVLGATSYVVLAGGAGWLRFAAQWWIGDGLGVLVVGATIVAVVVSDRPLRHRLAETLAVVGLIGLVTAVAFAIDSFVLLYVPVVLLLLASVRVGTRGVAMAGALLAFVAAQATAGGHTFWDTLEVTAEVGIVYLQLAIGLIIGCALFLAAALAEQVRSSVAAAEARRSQEAAEQAQRWAEELRLLAEELAACRDRAGVEAVMQRHGLRAADLEPMRASETHPGAEAARMAGAALERADLAEAERQARRRAELLEAQRELLAAVSEAMERATTVARRARLAVEALRTRGARAVALTVTPPGSPTVSVDDEWSDAGSSDVDRFELWARGRSIGVLRVARPGAGGWTPNADLADRIALLLDNAILYEAERDASHELQQGLLVSIPPDVAGLRIDSAYRPGTAQQEVGGDWSDVFELGPDTVGLVVGDVVGHTLAGATAMGQLRGATRALALTCGPAELLGRLDQFVATLPDAFMASVAYVELNHRSGALRYAVAGHPPPLVTDLTGEARFLWDGRAAPLGVDNGTPRADAHDVLHPAARLILYTDGLVERRGESIDVGLERLSRFASQHPPGVGGFVDRLCTRLAADSSRADDVCVLSVERHPAGTASWEIPAAVGELPALRGAVRDWLTPHTTPEAVADVVLVVSEVAANSIEHAYGAKGIGSEDGARVVVSARLDGAGRLDLAVRDDGGWMEPTPDPARRRGLAIVRALMDQVRVERGDDGTTVHVCRVLPRRTDAPWTGVAAVMTAGVAQVLPLTVAASLEERAPDHSGAAPGASEVRVLLSGDVDAASAAGIRARLDDVARTRAGRVVLDLSGVPFIDSAGVRMIVTVQQVLGGRLVLTGARPPVRRVFELASLVPDGAAAGGSRARRS